MTLFDTNNHNKRHYLEFGEHDNGHRGIHKDREIIMK